MRLQLAALAALLVVSNVAAYTTVRLPQQRTTALPPLPGRSSHLLAYPLADRRPLPAAPSRRPAPTRCEPPRCSEGGKALKLYPERWLMLGYLSLLAFLSDWVCFSVAAAPETWQSAYHHDPATLIDIFLFTNVFFCFLEPTLVSKFGLRKVIVGAGMLMAVGCALRSGIPFTGALPPYYEVVAGTVLVGAAQPFFQCTPPLLSATWFGPSERALATAIAINFNQVGIASAFLVGGEMASSDLGLSNYFGLITVASIIVSAGAIFQFQDKPLTPPSDSTAARDEAGEAGAERIDGSDGFLVAARALFKTPGFLPPLAAFVASIGISNVVSAFVDETLVRGGFDQGSIDLAGAGFQFAIVGGGILLGGFVDRTRLYKPVTQACLASAVLLLLALGVDGMPKGVVLAVLLSLGALIGPVQPINAELAVEVSYPADENAIEAVQQLCGNLFSAFLIPIAESAKQSEFTMPKELGTLSSQGDSLLLATIAAATFGFFSTFDAPLKRAQLDCAGDDEMDGCATDVLGGSEGEVDLTLLVGRSERDRSV